jgi:hypothetical protein
LCDVIGRGSGDSVGASGRIADDARRHTDTERLG